MGKDRPIKVDCAIPAREARTSLWSELFWIAEWAELRMSPVYHGAGIPRGSGQPVVVVPGFLGTDAHTGEMRGWLKRLGYATYPSGIGRNMDCPDVSLEKLEETLESVARRSGQSVRIGGHSLGGLLARAAAVRRPDLVSQVITLGSPLRVFNGHPLVLWVARLLGDVTPSPSVSPRRHDGHVHDSGCACELVEALGRPIPLTVHRTSIYNRRDGIVDWRSCRDAAPGRNVEVSSSHLGMLVNKDVYRAIADLLAAPAEIEEPPAARPARLLEPAA